MDQMEKTMEHEMETGVESPDFEKLRCNCTTDEDLRGIECQGFVWSGFRVVGLLKIEASGGP